MTDKQIIDGVEVNECAYFLYPLGCNSLDSKTCQCINDDCYYKQLKRKEQECERLAKGYAELTDIVSPYMDDFTGYNEELGGFDLILCVKELMDELDQLKAENEELKNLNTRLDNQRETYWKEYKNLKQTLTEIKEIAEGMHDLWINKTPYTDVVNLAEHIIKCELNRIRYKLDEISEVEDA